MDKELEDIKIKLDKVQNENEHLEFDIKDLRKQLQEKKEREKREAEERKEKELAASKEKNSEKEKLKTPTEEPTKKDIRDTNDATTTPLVSGEKPDDQSDCCCTIL